MKQSFPVVARRTNRPRQSCVIVVLVTIVVGCSTTALAGQLYVAALTGNTVRLYNTSGALIDSHLIATLGQTFGLDVSGDHVFVSSFDGTNTTIGQYTTAGTPSGPTINAGQIQAYPLAAAGSDLYMV